MHTHHSFDSQESFEHYLNTYQPDYFVSTEHLDFDNPYTGGKDSIPDYLAYQSEIAQLTQNYSTTILKGIEVGYVDTHHDRIARFLTPKHYDVILLSVHQDGDIDYMDDCVKKLNPQDLIIDYYSRMINAVKSTDFANILTHFDYGMRRISLSVENFKEMAEPLLIELFNEVIKKQLAFELNAKSFIKYNNRALYEYAVPLYQSLGGKLFTLGSDAHKAEDYQLGFDEMAQFLRDLGVTELATYQNQQLKMVPL